MSVVNALFNKELIQAEADMRAGTPDEIVARAEDYLILLEEYVAKLRTLKGIPRVADAMHSPFALELVDQVRGAVRSAIENATSERNRIETLITSFTEVSAWSAVDTFNLVHYREASDWALVGTHVRALSNGDDMSIPDAVDEAKRLRREAYFDSPQKS